MQRGWGVGGCPWLTVRVVFRTNLFVPAHAFDFKRMLNKTKRLIRTRHTTHYCTRTHTQQSAHG